MSFDPMAAAVDWLDAYRTRDLEAVLSMFTDDAIVECNCCGTERLEGREQLRAFWPKQFEQCGASEVQNLQLAGDGVVISYIACDGLIDTSIRFSPDGKISFMHWGNPAKIGANPPA